MERTGTPESARQCTELGSDVQIHPNAVVGYPYDDEVGPARVGDETVIRAGTVIYADVVLGDRVTTGHDVLIREHCVVGADTLIGTKSVLDGRVTVGSGVSIQTGVYIPPESSLGDRVFVGPGAAMTNDPYPLRTDSPLNGPTLRDDVSIGANVTLLPGVTVAEGAFVGAGSVVTDDVPARSLAVGVPARVRDLPGELDEVNNRR